ncbi:MAG: MAPEG family protein [Pseudomonadales bacterium]|jgi:uncharacterized MAPEG superfamily protein|nr:MAPEG family protein [Pseudomonadales bacterium]
MTIELQVLFWLALMLPLLFVVQATALAASGGLGWGLGNRDEAREDSPLLGRAKRTAANHVEALVLFTPLALIAAVTGVSNGTTETAALTFLGARIAFVVVYLIGIPYLRTAIWGVGLLAALAFAWGLFTGAP